MQQLATAIRGHADPLVDQYDARLRTMAGYSRLPESMRRELERHVLDLIAQCLETADAGALVEYVGQRASQWAAMGLDLTWFQQALTVLEDILVPMIDSAEASTFLWQALNRSQSAVWQMVAERAHKAEQTLRQSQQLLQTVMDNIPQAVFWKDRNLTYLGCNRAFAEDAGLASPTEIVGKTDYDMPWQPQADLYRADDQLVMDSGTAKINYEEPQTTPTGEQTWLRTSKVPMRDTAGNVTAVLGMYEDITERKRVEAVVRESQQRLSLLVQQSPLAVIEWNTDYEVVEWNPAAEQIFGYTREEVLGHHTAGFLVPEKARQQAPQAWQDLLAQKGTAHGTSKNLTKDGRLITCDWYNTPLVGADGNVIGVASLAQDITERRRMERQIQESLERRGRQVQTSTEVSQEIAAAPDLNELFRRVVTLIKEQFNYYHAQIFRYDPIQDAVVLVSGYGAAGQKMLAAGHRLQMGRGVVGTAAVSGESILATDVIQDADWRPNPHLPDTKGELAVPIKFRDQVLGILDVQSDQVGRLSEDDRLLLEGLCGQIAIAIESKRAEEALAREQYLMNALMNNLPDMIYFKDKQSRFIRISQSQSVRFGFGDPAQAIGKSDFDFFTEEHARPAYEDEQQIIQTGQPITKEEKETWPDRADTWVLTTKLPLLDENGNIVGTFGVSKDITERRQAEEALRQSEEKYRTILENIQDGYFEVDLAGNFTFFNDVLCGILGYSKDETMGMNYREYMDAESAKAVYRAFNEVYRTRKPSRDIHYELIRKSKARRSIEISASLITDSTGEPIGFRGTLRDITERRQAEEAIEEEQRRSQAILETVTVPMIISRLSDSEVLYANQALAQFRHMVLDELIGSRTTDYFVNPDDRNKLVEVLRRQGYANDFETQLRGSGGVVSWVLLSARIINFQNETCVLTSYVDITDRKRVEAEREQLLAQQQKRALQLQTAAEVSRAASSILSLDELLPQATELVRARFNLYYVGIFLVDESGQWAVLRAGTGAAGQQMLTAGHKLKVGGSSMISWCIVNRQARIALDVGEEAVRFDNPLLPLTRSEAALPLISRGSVIGAVTIQSDQPAAFTAEDITVLQTMADQISNATENARLFEQAQAALKEVDAINRRLTGEAWESYLRHRSSEQVIWVSDNDESAPAPLLKADETLSTGQIVIEPEEDKSQATVTAPIMLRGQTIGALRMQTPSAEWNEDVQTILTSIAGHIAQAAENTRLLEVTQERFARERALAEATDKIRRSTEVERVLETAAAELARYLNADTVAVHVSSNVASAGDGKHAQAQPGVSTSQTVHQHGNGQGGSNA